MPVPADNPFKVVLRPVGARQSQVSNTSNASLPDTTDATTPRTPKDVASSPKPIIASSPISSPVNASVPNWRQGLRSRSSSSAAKEGAPKMDNPKTDSPTPLSVSEIAVKLETIVPKESATPPPVYQLKAKPTNRAQSFTNETTKPEAKQPISVSPKPSNTKVASEMISPAETTPVVNEVDNRPPWMKERALKNSAAQSDTTVKQSLTPIKINTEASPNIVTVSNDSKSSQSTSDGSSLPKSDEVDKRPPWMKERAIKSSTTQSETAATPSPVIKANNEIPEISSNVKAVSNDSKPATKPDEEDKRPPWMKERATKTSTVESETAATPSPVIKANNEIPITSNITTVSNDSMPATKTEEVDNRPPWMKERALKSSSTTNSDTIVKSSSATSSNNEIPPWRAALKKRDNAPSNEKAGELLASKEVEKKDATKIDETKNRIENENKASLQETEIKSVKKNENKDTEHKEIEKLAQTNSEIETPAMANINFDNIARCSPLLSHHQRPSLRASRHAASPALARSRSQSPGPITLEDTSARDQVSALLDAAGHASPAASPRLEQMRRRTPSAARTAPTRTHLHERVTAAEQLMQSLTSTETEPEIMLPDLPTSAPLNQPRKMVRSVTNARRAPTSEFLQRRQTTTLTGMLDSLSMTDKDEEKEEEQPKPAPVAVPRPRPNQAMNLAASAAAAIAKRQSASSEQLKSPESESFSKRQSASIELLKSTDTDANVSASRPVSLADLQGVKLKKNSSTSKPEISQQASQSSLVSGLSGSKLFSSRKAH